MIRTENIHINSINRRSFLSSISVTEMIFLINILLWITRAKKNMMELLILAGSTIFLLLVIFLENKRAASKSFYKTKFYVFILLGLFIGIYDCAVFGMISGARGLSRFISMYLPIIMFDYYKTCFSNKRIQRDIKVIFGFWIIVSVAQLCLYLGSDFDYARVAVSTNKDLFTIAADPYGLSYAACLIGVVCFEKILMKGSPKKLRHVLLFILCGLVVVYTRSVITIIAFAIGGILVIFRRAILPGFGNGRKGKAYRILFSTLLAAAVFCGIWITRDETGIVLMDFAEKTGGIIGRRLNEVGQFLRGQGQSADISARFLLYTMSFMTALNHPFFGAHYEKHIYGTELVGNHSEILDTFANYGVVFGTTLFLLIFYNVFRQKREANGVSGVYIFVYMIISFLNPFHSFVSYFALFYMAPALANDWY